MQLSIKVEKTAWMFVAMMMMTTMMMLMMVAGVVVVVDDDDASVAKLHTEYCIADSISCFVGHLFPIRFLYV